MSGNKIAREILHYLAVKLYTINFNDISILFDATESLLSCEGRGK
jgi:hypothetical protein